MTNDANTAIQQRAPRVVAFICEGEFQAHLAARLNQEFQLVGVVIQQGRIATSQNILERTLQRVRRYLHPLQLAQYLIARLTLPYFAAKARRRFEQNFAPLLKFDNSTKTIRVDNINNPSVEQFIKDLAPEIVCVNGTQLIREPLLSSINSLPMGALNLHTGLSPYSRGGNCNLFMLLANKPELIGATIHRLDSGVDSGGIVTTLRPSFASDDPYELLEARVFVEGIEALVDAVKLVAKGGVRVTSQWEEGELFLVRTGYRYSPYLKVRANHMVWRGVLRDYLLNKDKRDEHIVTIPLQPKASND